MCCTVINQKYYESPRNSFLQRKRFSLVVFLSKFNYCDKDDEYYNDMYS